MAEQKYGAARARWAVMASALLACSGGGSSDLGSVELGSEDAGRDAQASAEDAGAEDTGSEDAGLLGDAGCDGADAGVPYDLVARGSDDTLPDSFYNSGNPDITPDGRYVVFESSEPGLVSPASNGQQQILLRDRERGTTTLVSARPDGSPGASNSYAPAISSDGCLVVFESASNDLSADDAHSGSDVFLRDLCATPPVTRLVSVDTNGRQFTRASSAPDISGDGSTVVFRSDHPQGTGDIYVYSVEGGGSSAITQGNFASTSPAVSDDGGRIAFWTFASNVLPADQNGVWDIVVYEREGGAFTCASSSAEGVPQSQGNEGSSTVTAPAISGDGRKVAFRSRGDGLVPGTSGLSQVYVKDLGSGAITIASVTDDGVLGDGDSAGGGAGIAPSLSYDGQVVAFVTNAPNLLAGDATASVGSVVRDLVQGNTEHPAGLTGSDAPVLSADARYLAVFSGESLDTRFDSSGVFVLDRTPPDSACGSSK